MEIDFNSIFSDFFHQITARIPNIISGIIILVVAIILGKIIYKIIDKATEKKWQDSILSTFLAQVIKWSIYLFGATMALSVFGFSGVAGTVFAGAGVSAIVFGFAFKDIGENFLAGIILALKRPFEIGDIIEIQGVKGTVKELDIRLTHLRNAEGKDIFIPNSSIIKNTLINYTKDGYLRINFMIGIAPECDIEETRKLILDYLDTNKNILKKPAHNVVVQELGEYTTDIQIFFWIDILSSKNLPDEYLGHNIRSKAITDIKRILDANNIEMPSQVLEHKMYRQSEIKLETK
ncbi:mechanosensitive ion channel family protein [Oceanihabitans sediminis]|uniref:mechanosensitive ion channel family protein n=1 Tax=Oceanihabitans sediminis TaxID=1812012 RepID=UPI00299E9714|nr:mechanosensitive ion channel family protein [Oceanihabitans sediminis]MDX1279107.1 mechanosensitive ion channel family protein [Oceanihabitans sediminis]